MLKAISHFGLSALLVIAPALCCCNVRLLAGQAGAHSTCPKPEAPLPSCCQSAKPVAKTVKKPSCCHQTDEPKGDSPSKPASPKPSHCSLCDEKPHATAPENAPSVAAPEPTGELLPLALIGLSAVAPEHIGLVGGLEAPDRIGVDVRFTTLFEHHVLRC